MTIIINGIEHDYKNLDEMPNKYKTTWHERNNKWFDTLFVTGAPILILITVLLIV